MKRFTETSKWTDPWYKKLTPGMKLLWNYLCDNCDAGGVIDLDLDIAAFLIGVEAGKLDVSKFGDRVECLPCGKYWLPKFVRFQYGRLSEDCKAHGPAFNSLRQYDLLHRLSIPFTKGLERDKEKDKDKDKVQDQETDKPNPLTKWFPETLRADAFVRKWSEWEDHLRESSKPITSSTRLAQLSACERAGLIRAIEVINLALTQGWKSLVWDHEPPKPNANRKPTPTGSPANNNCNRDAAKDYS